MTFLERVFLLEELLHLSKCYLECMQSHHALLPKDYLLHPGEHVEYPSHKDC